MAEKKAKAKNVSEGEYSEEEIVEFIVNLSNAGHSKSSIGTILRDQYGIGNLKKATGKTVSDVLTEKGLAEEIPEDMMNLITRSVVLQEHMAANKKDYKAKRGYQLAVSRIRRLAKYYIKNGKLPKGWRYSEETAKLLVK